MALILVPHFRGLVAMMYQTAQMLTVAIITGLSWSDCVDLFWHRGA